MLGIGDAEAHKNHNHANHHAHQHAHHHAHRAKIKKRQNHHKVTNYLVWIPGKWEIRAGKRVWVFGRWETRYTCNHRSHRSR